MSKDDYTDYHQYSWKVVLPPFKFSHFIYQRLLYSLPYLVLTSTIIWKYSSLQTIFVVNELRALGIGLSLTILAIIVWIDCTITRNFQNRIDRYIINKHGISINHSLYRYHQLRINSVEIEEKIKETSVKIAKKPFGSITITFEPEKEQL